MPLFSVIVPVYKTEQYLPQCVDSVLAQSFCDFELILVDDGSPDGSGAICDAYAARDNRVKTVHKENGGLVSARKAGLSVACGDYIANVDSDDYIAADLLEKLSSIIQDTHADVITFDGYRFTEDTTEPFCGSMPPGFYSGESLSAIHSNIIQNDRGEVVIMYGVCLKAVKRELYAPLQESVPNAISRGEDLAVTAPLLADCETVYVSDISGYYYRDNPKSIMNSFSIGEVAQMKLLLAHLTEKLGSAYGDKLNAYAAAHYFDFLDRAMLHGYSAYRNVIRQTWDPKFSRRLRNARSSDTKLSLIFFLMRCKCFFALWLLRKLKPRQ